MSFRWFENIRLHERTLTLVVIFLSQIQTMTSLSPYALADLNSQTISYSGQLQNADNSPLLDILDFNVGIYDPSGTIAVTNSPVTSTGTLTGAWATQTANKVLAAPNSSPGAPSFRALASADIPNLDASKITTGTLPVVNGGTGLTSLGNNQTLTTNGTGVIIPISAGAAGAVLTQNNLASTPSYNLITNANIDGAAAIADSKLATIATAGKVSNSATTATSANTNSAIVARDVSGNFSASTITANLTGNVTGNVTGASSLNILKSGDTMGGELTLATGSTSLAPLNIPSNSSSFKTSPISGDLEFDGTYLYFTASARQQTGNVKHNTRYS